MYENLDELLMERNPKGGRPMHVGTLFYKDQMCVDVSAIKEETQIRYHLGYCTCGRRIVIGPNRVDIIVERLARKGMAPKRAPLRERVGRFLLRGVER